MNIENPGLTFVTLTFLSLYYIHFVEIFVDDRLVMKSDGERSQTRLFTIHPALNFYLLSNSS